LGSSILGAHNAAAPCQLHDLQLSAALPGLELVLAKEAAAPAGEAAVGDGAGAGELMDRPTGAVQPPGDVLDEEIGTERRRECLTHRKPKKHICFK